MERPLIKDYATRNRRNADIRKLLASYILLSLEVLIVADLIESVIKTNLDRHFKISIDHYHSHDHLFYFLNLEIASHVSHERGKFDGNQLDDTSLSIS